MARPSPTTPEALRKELKHLVLQHVYKKSDQPIQLSSGAQTNEYYDVKQVTLFPERSVLFARLLSELLNLRDYDAVGGMSIGADPIVSATSIVAYLEKGIHLPMFLVRNEVKVHGLQKKIEGVEIKRGMKVLIVDDVITQGTATLSAIRAVEELGAIVKHIACLIDREEGGSKAISEKYPFLSVFKKSELQLS